VNAITTENHGPLIVASSYWGSDVEAAGKLWASCNAGAIRLMLPRSARELIQEMRTGKTVILSRGPWPEQRLAEAVEIMFDDGSDNPYCLHLSPESFDLLPAEPPADQGWVLSVWDFKKGKPHKALERPCHWRRVPRLPWLKPL
jgi:hypothetical protein